VKRLLWLALILCLVFAAGCDRLREDVEGATEDPSPSPEPEEVTFELQGVVVEASGSAAVTGTRQETSPTPVTRTPATPTSTNTPTATTSPTQVTTAIIERAAPGSIALKLVSFDAGDSPCAFQENDVLVVAYTRSTTFEPQDLTEVRGFPNNLQGLTLNISGQVIGDECLLLAKAVTVQEGAQETERRTTPTPTTTSARRTPTPTPTR
jgi:hypothetical protein